jgi:hypothetical protein
MDKTVSGVFDDFTAAQLMVPKLINEGFPKEGISLVAPDTSAEAARYFNTSSEAHPESTVGTGAVLGGLGGLLLGAATLVIPGLGLLYAMGPLAAMIAGTTVGAVAGGLVGALNGLGIPEYEHKDYEEGIREGRSYVFVRTDEARAERAAELMRERRALRVGIYDAAEPLPRDDMNENRA